MNMKSIFIVAVMCCLLSPLCFAEGKDVSVENCDPTRTYCLRSDDLRPNSLDTDVSFKVFTVQGNAVQSVPCCDNFDQKLIESANNIADQRAQSSCDHGANRVSVFRYSHVCNIRQYGDYFIARVNAVRDPHLKSTT